MCRADVFGLLYRDEDAEILAVDVAHQEDVYGPVSLRRYGHQEMTVEARDVGVLKAEIGCDFLQYGYVEEEERVGKFASLVAHVRGIKYFCDECEVRDGGDVHSPYVCGFPHATGETLVERHGEQR